jgi:hypothetical protein
MVLQWRKAIPPMLGRYVMPIGDIILFLLPVLE